MSIGDRRHILGHIRTWEVDKLKKDKEQSNLKENAYILLNQAQHVIM